MGNLGPPAPRLQHLKPRVEGGKGGGAGRLFQLTSAWQLLSLSLLHNVLFPLTIQGLSFDLRT